MCQAGAQQEMAWNLRYMGHVWQTPWQAKALYQKALAIFEEVGDERGVVETRYRLGWSAVQLGDYQEAERLYQDSLTTAQKLGRREIILNCLVELGHVYWVLGNYQKAEGSCRQSISIAAEIGYHGQIARAYRNLARIAASLGDHHSAKKYLQDSLAIYEELGLRGMKAETLGELGHVTVYEQDFNTAKRLAQDSLSLCRELEYQAGLIEPYTVLGEAGLGLGDFRAAAQYFDHALQVAVEVWEPSYALHALVGVAQLLAATGEKVRACEVATLILHHPASWQWSKNRVAPLAAELEAELPAEVVAALQSQDQEKTLEEMVKAFTSRQALNPQSGVEPELETAARSKQMRGGKSSQALKVQHGQEKAQPRILATPAALRRQNARSNRYDILDEIGQGGFAVVYRARDTELDRVVALKELRSSFLADAEWVKRFRQEARAIARLDHPGIVTIHDIGQAADRLFIVMRLVDGPSLAEQIVAQGRLEWPEAVEIMTVIAAALDYAHTQQFIHRDLKPGNILLDPERGPLLTDFGLAKLVSENSMSQSGNVVGTPHYIAPEAWEGQTVGIQTDIYALGCVLYEMLTGQKLFAGESPPSVMMAHFKPPALPQEWPEGVPPGLTEVLTTALAKNPEERFPSAGMLAQGLRQAIS